MPIYSKKSAEDTGKNHLKLKGGNTFNVQENTGCYS